MSLFNISDGEMRKIVFVHKYMKIYIYNHLLSSPYLLVSADTSRKATEKAVVGVDTRVQK